MKHTVKSIIVLAALVVLTGCQTNTNAESEPAGPIEPIDVQKERIYSQMDNGNPHFLEQVERTKPVWAGVSHSSHTGYVNTDYFIELTDESDLQFIVDEMIVGSERQPGIVSMSPSYYDMTIEYEDGSTEQFFLWLGEGFSGTVMDTEDTHYIYTFGENVSERFLSLLPEESILESPKTAEWIEGDTFGKTIIIEPYIEEDIDDLIEYSDYIVKGTYVNDEPSEVPDSWGDEGTAFFPFDVTTVLKGDLEPGIIEVGQSQYIVDWAQDPETNTELGILKVDNPLISQPELGKEVILFISTQFQDGEFWRFSEPTMVEVMDDGSLKSTSAIFDPEFDASDRVEHIEYAVGWNLELTLQILSDNLPLPDPFEGMTVEDLTERIY